MKWDEDIVSKMIRNPIYYGCFKADWICIENQQPAFVSKELAEKANASLDAVIREKKYTYVYSGRVKCSDCGKWTRNDVTLKVRSSKGRTLRIAKKYKYYECPSCLKRINENKIHRYVYPRLKAAMDDCPKDLEIYLELLEKQKRMMKKSQILENNFLDGLLSEDEYEGERKNLLYNLKKIKFQIKEAEKRDTAPFMHLSDLEKKVLFQKYYSNIEYSFENKTFKLNKLDKNA